MRGVETPRYYKKPVKNRLGKHLRRTLMKKISPFLWFDNQAEEAAQFYTSLQIEEKI
jgi:hypothetical protein